jgi:hypothetical protein
MRDRSLLSVRRWHKMSKIDYIFKSCLLICKQDRGKAKEMARAEMKRLLNLESLWIPRRVEHGQRLLEEA